MSEAEPKNLDQARVNIWIRSIEPDPVLEHDPDGQQPGFPDQDEWWGLRSYEAPSSFPGVVHHEQFFQHDEDDLPYVYVHLEYLSDENDDEIDIDTGDFVSQSYNFLDTNKEQQRIKIRLVEAE